MNWILVIAFICGVSTNCPPESPFNGTAMWIGFEDKLDCLQAQASWVEQFKVRNPGAFESGKVMLNCIPNEFNTSQDGGGHPLAYMSFDLAPHRSMESIDEI